MIDAAWSNLEKQGEGTRQGQGVRVTQKLKLAEFEIPIWSRAMPGLLGMLVQYDRIAVLIKYIQMRPGHMVG
jgi:hypothetical protein